MQTTRRAADVLDRDFINIRHMILNIAAAMDRIDRASDASAARDDARMKKIHEALAVVNTMSTDRARSVQMLFSRPFESKRLA